MFKDDDDEDDNTFGVTRYPCMPSLVALQQMRNRLHLANLGKKLMKWTALATGSELRNIAAQIDEIYKTFTQDVRDAFIALARCRYFYPNLNRMVVEGCPNVAEVVFTTSMRTTSGVKIFKYHVIENNTHPYEHLGIEKGGQTIQETKKIWLELLKRLIFMVELRTDFKLVEEMHNTANKKWNVLSKMIIPRATLSTKYILSELEEMEREDNFRLKRFKELKLKKQQKRLKLGKKLISENDNEEVCSEIEQAESVEVESERNTQNSDDMNLHVPRAIIRKEDNLGKITFEQVEKGIKVEKVQKRVTIEAKISGSLIDIQKLYTNGDKDNVVECECLEWNNEAIKCEEEQQNDDNIGDYCSCPPLSPSSEKLTDNESIDKGYCEILDLQVKDALLHTEEILDLVKQNEKDSPCLNNCLSTWTELKSVLEEMVLNRICDKCKKKLKGSSEDDAPSLQNMSKTSAELSKLSILDSIFSIKPENENKLGNYEKKYRETIKVLRLQNEDGTIRQERKIITVKTDKRNPMKAEPFGDPNKVGKKVVSTCSCNDISEGSESSQSQCKNELQSSDTDKINNDGKRDSSYRPYSTKSEPMCSNRQWNEPKVRSCMSAGSVKETMKLDAVNCSCLGDITVNLNFQNKSSDKLHNINIRKLPLVSSINVNFCNFSESTEESKDDNNLCCSLKQTNETSNAKESTSKVNDDAECLCDDVLEYTLDKCCQTFNQIGCELDAMVKNTYVSNSNDQEDDKHKNASLQLPDFTYIFSKVEKVSSDDPVDTEGCCIKKPAKTYFKQYRSDSSMFAYIFSTLKRIEIDNMLKNACSYAPEFPYVFSKLLKETFDNNSHLPCNSKHSDIGAMFNDACKRTYNCTYIFSHLKNIKINAMFKSSCKKKNDFPYMFSNVRDDKQILVNDDSNSTKAEIEKMIKSACKRLTDFTYILNHLNTIKIDNMIKDACSNSMDFPYLFSKIDNSTSSKHELESNAMKIDQMFKESSKHSNYFPYIQSRVEQTNSKDINKVSSKNVERIEDDFSYIFKEVSKECNVNNEETNKMFTDVCTCTSELNFNTDEPKTFEQNLYHEKDESCEENKNFIINSFHCKNNGICKFKYIYKNKIFKDGIEDISTKFTYAVTKMTESSTSTSADTFNYNDIEIMFKQACKHKSDFLCCLNKLHGENSNKNLLRASDTKLQSMKKFIEMSNQSEVHPHCITMKNSSSNNNSIHSCKVFTKLDINKSDVNGEKQDPNGFSSTVQCSGNNDLFKELCTAVNEFEEINSHELVRRSSGLRTQNIAKTMFNDACKRKNEFTYVVTKLKTKKTIQLARRTSNLRLQEISMFEDAKFQLDLKMEPCLKPKFKRDENSPCILTKVSEFIQLIAPTCEEMDEPCLESFLTQDYIPEVEEKVSEGLSNSIFSVTCLCDKEDCIMTQKINKMIKDSCVVCVNPKHNYIFQKVKKSEKDDKTFDCLCEEISEILPQSYVKPTSVPCNDVSSSLSCIHCQSTCSLTYKNSPQNFLVNFPNITKDSGRLGVAVTWQPPCLHDNEFETNQMLSNVTSATDGELPCGSDSICQHTDNGPKIKKATNERSNERDNISLIRRMLDSVRNVYVPFTKTVKPKVNKEVSCSKTDNGTSLISKSSTSTYSWKSCVMKTCQAEIDTESIRKKISYSCFSFGSSLNLASYKNKAASSVTSNAENSDTGEQTCCSHIQDTVGSGKHIMFGVRMNSVTSVYSTDSNSYKKPDSSDGSKTFEGCKCSSEARNKCAPSSRRGECSHFLDAQNKYTCGLGNKPNPLRTTRYQSVISLRGTCSVTPVVASRQVRGSEAECSCKTTNQSIDIGSKWKGCCGGSVHYNVRKTKGVLKKSRSLDEKCSCCSKPSYL